MQYFLVCLFSKTVKLCPWCHTSLELLASISFVREDCPFVSKSLFSPATQFVLGISDFVEKQNLPRITSH